MALDPVKNFAISRVATAPSPADSGTTLVVETGDGALFPDPSSSGAYNVVIYPNGEQPTSTNAEIVRVTARTSDTMTITREEEGTSARTIAQGDIVMLAITAKVVSDLSTAVTGVVTETGTQTLTNKTLTAPALTSPTITSPTISGTWDGWISAGETWTYASADDPTFTFTVGADVTTKYSVGMKIKLTQGTVKYFIITAISAFTGGNTTITVYGGTDYDLASLAISANAYSMMRTPVGFPMSPLKWTQTYSDSGTNRTQGSPTNDAWYNINTALLSVPVGVWRLGYRVLAGASCSSATTYIQVFTTLSTSNNNASDSGFTALIGGDYASANLNVSDYREVEKTLALTSKTTYYLNTRTFTGGTISNISNSGFQRPILIYAECAYL